MLAELKDLKAQLDIVGEEEDEKLTFSLMMASDGARDYCKRDFLEYKLPGEDNDKEQLPWSIKGAVILWAIYNYKTGGSIGLTSERIDGLGQKNYMRLSQDGKLLAAPAHVLAMLNPYRRNMY